MAQIAGGLAAIFRLKYANDAVAAVLPGRATVQAIGMTHDLGHPPFGHGGEVALNYCMRDHGGFEGNGQTLRILSKLEKFSETAGANLTRRSLLGVLKYPVPYTRALNPDAALEPRLLAAPTTIRLIDRKGSKPPKCYMDSEADIVEWILRPLATADRDAFTEVDNVSKPDKPKHHASRHKSLDCSIMDVADDISFGVHDLEDGIALGLLSEEAFRQHVPEAACEHFIAHMNQHYSGFYGNDVYEGWRRILFGGGRARKRQISRLVDYLMRSCVIEEEPFAEPLLRFRARLLPGARRFLDALMKANREAIIYSPTVQQMELRGQGLVIAVFEALCSEPDRFLPLDARTLAQQRRGCSRHLRPRRGHDGSPSPALLRSPVQPWRRVRV